MYVTKNMMVQQTLGWFGAYPEKQQAFRDLAEAVDMAAVPIMATKQPITPSIPTARALLTRLTSLQNLRSRPF